MSDEDVPSPSAPRIGAAVIQLAEVGELRALFNQWRGRFEQVSRGHFSGLLKVASGHWIRVLEVSGNQQMRIRGFDAAGMVSVYAVTAGCASSVWQGRRFEPGRLVVTGTCADVDHFSTRRVKANALSLHPATFREAARSLLGDHDAAAPVEWSNTVPPPEAFAGLQTRMAKLLDAATSDPTFLHSAECRQLEQECLRSLMSALDPARAASPVDPLPVRSAVVRRAEELMRSRLENPVGAVELCREAGVSERTLRLAFLERYTLGPMAYYKCIRLNAVRARLSSSSPPLVAAAAREFGFHHLGNFAAEYHRLFGEHPSDTVRRKMESPEAPVHHYPLSISGG